MLVGKQYADVFHYRMLFTAKNKMRKQNQKKQMHSILVPLIFVDQTTQL